MREVKPWGVVAGTLKLKKKKAVRLWFRQKCVCAGCLILLTNPNVPAYEMKCTQRGSVQRERGVRDMLCEIITKNHWEIKYISTDGSLIVTSCPGWLSHWSYQDFNTKSLLHCVYKAQCQLHPEPRSILSLVFQLLNFCLFFFIDNKVEM